VRRCALIAGLSLLAVAALPAAQASTDARSGGIFRVSFQGSSSLHAFDHVDPALAYSRESWTLLDTVCARLMRYRDLPPPQGYQLVPEVAAAPPKVSRDGRTWTFRLRTGFRFSDGRPVDAHAFAHAIHRTMAPDVDSPGWLYTRAIVGADDVRAGRASRAVGVEARASTLVVRFTRPVGALDAWTTMPFFCAVPPTLPTSSEGVRTFPGAGPYYVSEYRPNQRIVIRRNRYYGGDRAHHVDGFDVDLSADSPEAVLDRIEAGKADWGYTKPHAAFGPGRNYLARYFTKSRFFVDPGLTVAMFALNSSRPLFKDNPDLRRAVNLALPRSQFTASPAAAYLTDQLLPRSVAAFRERRVYPDDGDLARATALAAGNLREGKANLYIPACAGVIACAQFVGGQLEQIGLEVEIRPFAEWTTASAYLGRLGDPDEPWDLALILWAPDFVDPYAYVNRLLGGQEAGGTGLAGFDEHRYIDLMRRAAGLRGAARDRAYAALDLELTREAAPIVSTYVMNETTLVSARVGCVLRRPSLVMTTVCLTKRR
jgi:ABC-type oligopeptide transport system substrate-binding subunit